MKQNIDKKCAIARVLGIMTKYNISLVDIQLELYRIGKGFSGKKNK